MLLVPSVYKLDAWQRAGKSKRGVKHPKWDERPLLVCVRDEGSNVCATEVRDFLVAHVAKWWLPDAVEFVDELPHTATGKLSKKTLRDQFKDYRFADAEAMVGRD